ncbi:MAG: rhomboid family intramembrane serine protease [Polyangiaceae bacterium]|nr:rhomboid family intramembrane serine protease [Polyangiaceae bacterium]
MREAALVLTSKQIQHHIVWAVGGGYLVVRDRDYDRARLQLDRYEQENRDFPPRRRVERAKYMGPPLLALAFLVLVGFAWVTGPVAKPNGPWFREGASVASLVLTSEPFRAVTALTLHADGAHVLSNLVSGAVFGRALEKRVAGRGPVRPRRRGHARQRGQRLVLRVPRARAPLHRRLHGGVRGDRRAGDDAAAARRPSHDDVSAGLPAGGPPLDRVPRPVTSGLALLGALGSGPETDVWAHAFGLLAGFLVGLPIALGIKAFHKGHVWRRSHVAAQVALGALALGAVGASWALAAV